jgi:hypothetical protein
MKSGYKMTELGELAIIVYRKTAAGKCAVFTCTFRL